MEAAGVELRGHPSCQHLGLIRVAQSCQNRSKRRTEVRNRYTELSVQHGLNRGYEVIGVCRAESVGKLNAFKGRITVIPGATNDREVIKSAVAGCDGVLAVLAPMGVHQYSSGTAQAVLDHARPGARLVFSCGWHITRDGQDVYSWKIKVLVNVVGRLARLARMVDLDDQVEACRRVFASDTRWTVVRGSDLEEGWRVARRAQESDDRRDRQAVSRFGHRPKRVAAVEMNGVNLVSVIASLLGGTALVVP